VVLAGEEAGLAFDLMLSVRNKVVEAYQEVMRTQV
jgi:flagellar hook-basal body complex protein FliE